MHVLSLVGPAILRVGTLVFLELVSCCFTTVAVELANAIAGDPT